MTDENLGYHVGAPLLLHFTTPDYLSSAASSDLRAMEARRHFVNLLSAAIKKFATRYLDQLRVPVLPL